MRGARPPYPCKTPSLSLLGKNFRSKRQLSVHTTTFLREWFIVLTMLFFLNTTLAECNRNRNLESHFQRDVEGPVGRPTSETQRATGFARSTKGGSPPLTSIKGSLVEKLPSYGDLKMQRVQYSNSSSSSAK